MWYYKDSEFTSEMIGDYLGFVYLITEIKTSKRYVGKKLFKQTRRLKPLKGKKRKRIVVSESDWKDYYSSSETVKKILMEDGPTAFKREILHLCKSKGAMSYLEAKEQFDRNVLLREDYHNGIIQCRINHKHLKELK